VTLVLGAYPRYSEINDFKKLEGVPLTLVEDYFPQYAHMDVLNIIGAPVSLTLTDGTPSSADLVYMNGIKPLRALLWEMKVMPDASHYELLAKLKRGEPRSLALQWTFSTPRELDVEAWLKLQPERLLLDTESFSKHEARLRELRGQIIVETFSSAVDGRRRMEFSPQL
jgi:hypothetical protein